MNMTLKDLNRETVGLLRKALLKENLKNPRNELEVYVSGPCFPCGDSNFNKRSLKKNSKASEGVKGFRENISVACFKDGQEKRFRNSDNKIGVKTFTNGFTEDTLKVAKDNITTNARFSESYITIQGNCKDEVINSEHAELKSLESMRTPMLDVDNYDGAVASRVSSASKPELRGSDSDSISNGRVLKSEKRSSKEFRTNQNSLNETDCVEPEKTRVVKSNSVNKTKTPALSVSDETKEKLISKLSKEELVGFSTTGECLGRGKESLYGNRKFFDRERNQLPSASKFRRLNSQLEPLSSRGTSPLLERKHERRLSSRVNKNTTTTTSLNNKHISTTDQFCLENISNPLLRESLKKILNAQSNMEDFEVTPNSGARDETTSIIAKGNGTGLLEEQQSLLPNIKDPLKDSLLDFYYQTQRSSLRSNNFDKKKQSTVVRFEENKQSADLYSKKCAGIVVRGSHPVRMISGTPEYAVKGLIGQWLKRHSGKRVGERDKPSVQKQERLREVQLLKVGLSMRMLAGIV